MSGSSPRSGAKLKSGFRAVIAAFGPITDIALDIVHYDEPAQLACGNSGIGIFFRMFLRSSS
jgi:hypothetical protein